MIDEGDYLSTDITLPRPRQGVPRSSRRRIGDHQHPRVGKKLPRGRRIAELGHGARDRAVQGQDRGQPRRSPDLLSVLRRRGDRRPGVRARRDGRASGRGSRPRRSRADQPRSIRWPRSIGSKVATGCRFRARCAAPSRRRSPTSRRRSMQAASQARAEVATGARETGGRTPRGRKPSGRRSAKSPSADEVDNPSRRSPTTRSRGSRSSCRRSRTKPRPRRSLCVGQGGRLLRART